MKVCLIIPTLKQGGAERVMSELANEFASWGLEIHLVLLARSEVFYSINKEIIIHSLGFTNKGRTQKILAQFQTLVKLRKLIKHEKPDFVLSFMTKYSILTIISALGLDTPVFVSDRSNPKKNIGRVLSFLRRKFYSKTTGIIAQTSLAKEILQEETGSNNIKVIPNPLREISKYPALQKEKLIINVGRLVPEKGHQYLLKAFSELESPEWKLVILGDGPLRNELLHLAEKLNISDRLIMPGSVENVDEWFARSSLFVFSSVSEGFPNALVEAMAAGLPCISFDCDAGPRDIIEHNTNGVLVETANVGQLVKEITELIGDEKRLKILGDNAKRIKCHLDVKEISLQYFNFCKN